LNGDAIVGRVIFELDHGCFIGMSGIAKGEIGLIAMEGNSALPWVANELLTHSQFVS
jgi:hypothetical protein